MNTNLDLVDPVAPLLAAYGTGQNGDAPTPEQWQGLMQRDAEKPLTLINFFKIRETAAYPAGSEFSGSGQAAFDRYAETSIPSMQAAGGAFLLIAPYEGVLLGHEPGGEEDWDLIAIGRYPNVSALLTLFRNTAYAEAFPHRTAACLRQKVMICNG